MTPTWPELTDAAQVAGLIIRGPHQYNAIGDDVRVCRGRDVLVALQAFGPGRDECLRRLVAGFIDAESAAATTRHIKAAARTAAIVEPVDRSIEPTGREP